MLRTEIDVSQLFLTYITLNGDVGKTAVVLYLDRQVVEALAEKENWDSKLKLWNELADGNGPDLNFEINRTLNYVQAKRLRAILDRMISRLEKMSDEELMELFTKRTDGRREFCLRPLCDLIKAAEACQLMTQRALGDTPTERPVYRERRDRGATAAQLVMVAMNSADKAGLDSLGVVREVFVTPEEKKNL